jgi:hypothetical protein
MLKGMSDSKLIQCSRQFERMKNAGQAWWIPDSDSDPAGPGRDRGRAQVFRAAGANHTNAYRFLAAYHGRSSIIAKDMVPAHAWEAAAMTGQ